MTTPIDAIADAARPPGEDISNDIVRLILDAIEGRLFDVHTGLPATVVSFDPTKQSADVQPLLRRVMVDENESPVTVTIPVITNVPIQYPSGAGWSITWPLAVGDIVYLHFAERSIDDWLEAPPGSLVTPTQARKFDLSDAVVLAGIRPRTLPLPNISPTNLRIANETGTVVLELSANSIHVQAPTVALDAGGTADSPIPRGADLQTFLEALRTWLSTLSLPVSGATAGPPAAPPPVIPATLLSTAATVR